MNDELLANKIAGMGLNSIYNMSPNALKELTNGFSEPIVRQLMMKAVTIDEQKELMKYLKNVYGICQKRVNSLWSEHHFIGGYPEYFYTMEANIESGRIITINGSLSVGSTEYHKLISQLVNEKASEKTKKDILNVAIATVKSQIPRFEYDQQSEKLSVVQGVDIRAMNTDEIFEKKTKAITYKQLQEECATDADVDEIFANDSKSEKLEKTNKEIFKTDESKDNDDIDVENDVFKSIVSKPEKADDIIQRLEEFIKEKKTPKEITLPIRAAMDAGAISRPPWSMFCKKFGFKIESTWKSAYHKYTNPKQNQNTHPYINDEAFETIKRDFEKLIQ